MGGRAKSTRMRCVPCRRTAEKPEFGVSLNVEHPGVAKLWYRVTRRVFFKRHQSGGPTMEWLIGSARQTLALAVCVVLLLAGIGSPPASGQALLTVTVANIKLGGVIP